MGNLKNMMKSAARGESARRPRPAPPRPTGARAPTASGSGTGSAILVRRAAGGRLRGRCHRLPSAAAAAAAARPRPLLHGGGARAAASMAAAAAGGGGGGGAEVFGRRWEVFPRMIVFDVDYTLWPYWVDTHTRAPYMKAMDGSGKVWDASRKEIVLFPETAKLLTALRAVPGLQIAYASRTGQPRWLEELAKLLPITDDEGTSMSMWDLPDYREIYPGSKLKHFERLAAKSSIPCSDSAWTHIVYPIMPTPQYTNTLIHLPQPPPPPRYSGCTILCTPCHAGGLV
jgi:magnesium-dependent phosphatase-1